MKKVKTHTFKLGRYNVDIANGADGATDTPDRMPWKYVQKEIMILDGKTLRALITSVHEAMHAEDIDERIVHGGTPDRIARFLWRLGWRKKHGQG